MSRGFLMNVLIWYLDFARVGGFHILISFHARFRCYVVLHAKRFTSQGIIYIFTETITRCYNENCPNKRRLQFKLLTPIQSEREKNELRF